MSAPGDKQAERDLAGLCADCSHAQRILSERGALFLLCGLSFRDPRFAKYPRLPVLRCLGFVPCAESAGVDSEAV
jgi:hypothetical protein